MPSTPPSSTSNFLTGKVILITRPIHQAAGICELIASAGGETLCFPLLEIADPEDLSSVNALLRRLTAFDLAIFISSNAVRKTVQLLDRQHIKLPAPLRLAAIGSQTRATLLELGYRVDVLPQPPFNSEAFLAMPEIQRLANRRIVIFRGLGGRELLGETLLARGACVEYAEVYRRMTADLKSFTIENYPLLQRIDYLTLTSTTAVQTLYELVINSRQIRLLRTCLFVGGSRMAEQARALGFTDIELAENPTDSAMFQAILNRVRRERCNS